MTAAPAPVRNDLAAVFVHGTRTSGRIWDEQAAALSGLGITATAIDLPGHGSRMNEDFDLASAHEAIREAIAASPAGSKILLVGLSLGGYLSLDYAAAHPDRIAGVVAAGCSSETSGKPLRLYRDLAQGADNARRALSRIGTRVRGGAVDPCGDGSQPRRAPAARAVPDARGVAGTPIASERRPDWRVVTQMLTALAGTSARNNLRAIPAPVWLVSGERCPLRFEARRFLRVRGDLTHTVVRGAGHDVNTEAPAAFNALLAGVVVGGKLRT
ncbi:alpha/beta hydrolase [Rarobacter faecitabidus]|nr:alpha/beta hydrolase [Rarobacter faecitabidus]